MRFSHIIAAACLAFLCALSPAHADKRVALVVGNGAYRHDGVPKLANPVNDARGMRDALTTLRFDVLYGEDLDLKGLQGVIGRFADRVDGADVAVVYFAGHGATFGDTPYVVPVDAAFSSLRQVPYELVPVETLIGELRQAKGVRIAILDACRDNGAERDLKRQAARGGEVSRGLAPMKNPSGLIIAYATQYGATAADDAGGAGLGSLFSWGSSSASHSPFTAALLNNIAAPGLDVKDIFYKVGRDVVQATGGKQRPEISISIYEQYALVPVTTVPPNAASGSPPSMSAAVTTPAASASPAPKPAKRPPPNAGGQGVITVTSAATDFATFLKEKGVSQPSGDERDALFREFLQWQQARQERPATAPAAPEPSSQVAVVAPPVTPAVPAADPCRGAVTASSASRCVPLTSAQERRLQPKDRFQECENCPEMVMVPAGAFTMGSPEGEKDGWGEGPQHVVTIARPFAVGKFHVTRDQFGVFARETGYTAHSGCDWRNPGFVQEPSHPVVCINWDDAKAYASWLARKTGKAYRLLSESEWEFAARGQTSPGNNYSRFWFGDNERDLCRYGNIEDQNLGGYTAPCNDGYPYTSPAGHYQPNAFGLYDMFGNAWQLTADCWHGDYNGAPVDGSAWTSRCEERFGVVRGGSWNDHGGYFRAAFRYWFSNIDHRIGFRIARTLTP